MTGWTSRSGTASTRRGQPPRRRAGVGGERHQVEVDPDRAHHHDGSARRVVSPTATHGTASFRFGAGHGRRRRHEASRADQRRARSTSRSTQQPLGGEAVERVGRRARPAVRRDARHDAGQRRRPAGRRRGRAGRPRGRGRRRRPRGGRRRGRVDHRPAHLQPGHLAGQHAVLDDRRGAPAASIRRHEGHEPGVGTAAGAGSGAGSAATSARPSTRHTRGGVAEQRGPPGQRARPSARRRRGRGAGRPRRAGGPTPGPGRGPARAASSARTHASPSAPRAAPPPNGSENGREPRPHASRTRAPSLASSSAWRRCGSSVTPWAWPWPARLALAVAALEALDAATGVHQLLLAGEERVALVAELDVELAGLGGPGGEGVAARAARRW